MPSFEEILFGKTYEPQRENYQVRGMDELEGRYDRAAGNYNAAAEIGRLATEAGRVAGGREMGAGEMAAQTSQDQATAAQLALARSRRGYGAGAGMQQAARNIAYTAGDAAGARAIARAQDQGQARQLQANLLQGLQAGEMNAAAQIAALRQAELNGNMTWDQLQQQRAAQDQGILPGLIDIGVQGALMYAGLPPTPRTFSGPPGLTPPR